MQITPKALTIAGSDSGGGAGIQADLKTFQELGAYGMSVITAVTAQNTLGVQGVFPLDTGQVAAQLQSIQEDLVPEAVKTGMLFSPEIIEAVAGHLSRHRWKNLVVDPVMIAKGGAELLRDEAVVAMMNKLIPLAEVVTPNGPEAEKLTGVAVKSLSDQKEAAKRLADCGVRHVVVKGGHMETGDLAIDLLYDGSDFYELEGERLNTKQTHGTGCTFAAAITAELAKGKTVHEAIKTAKDFIQAAISHPLHIGSGHGPTNHWAYRGNENAK